MSENTNPPPKKRMRWGKIILVLSLGFNMLIVGLIVGSKIGDDRRASGPGGPGRALGLGPYFNALTIADKATIGKEMRQVAGSLREGRRELRRQAEAFILALRSDPFDSEILAELLETQRAQIGGLQMQGQQLLIERIEAMDAQERTEYADRVLAALKRGPGRNSR